MEPQIVQKESILLAGFSFFGNPFEAKDPWSEENEIGRLWRRLMTFRQQKNVGLPPALVHHDAFYEVHLTCPDTPLTGEFEVFAGIPVEQIHGLPVELVFKVLPPAQYAVFTLTGEQINSDWDQLIYRQWFPTTSYAPAHNFNFQYYDHRFKGMDKLTDSSIDVYIPIKQQTP